MLSEADILSSFAFADARHDFGREFTANYTAVLQESLPGRITWISSDDAVLDTASRMSENTMTELRVEDANELFLTLGGSSDTSNCDCM